MHQITTTQSTPTMSSREMAELTEKRHDSVKRTIETLLAKGIISQPQIVNGEKYANGVTEKLYLVEKRDSHVIVAQLSPEFTARLVDRWQELESKAVAALPDFTNPAEAARAWAAQYEERRKLESKVVADAPKVEFAEAVRAIDSGCKVELIAKTLGYGRTKFFKMLREDSVLMKNNLPYQRYIDRGYFVVAENSPYVDKEGAKHATFTTKVTGAGQVFLVRKYGRRSEDRA